VDAQPSIDILPMAPQAIRLSEVLGALSHALDMTEGQPVGHCVDEHWIGGGKPLGLKGAAIPVYARIALLAQVVNVFLTSAGEEAARREAWERAGTWLEPPVVAAFEHVPDRRRSPRKA
jgi:response regulator RpfG family c-di-GMP phosphodiesterase